MNDVKLNLGCGAHTPEGWVNVDYALGARIAKIPGFRALNRRLRVLRLDWDPDIRLHDLGKPFPWDDDSVDVVYSSHTLEHLDRQAGRHFLGESFRVLRPGGLVRIVVPDLRAIVESYLQGEVSAPDFVDRLQAGYVFPEDGFLKRKLAPFFRYPHRCMYDAPSLLRILDEIGFDARSRGAFDSDIPDIDVIELEGRTQDAVIVEGSKRSSHAHPRLR